MEECEIIIVDLSDEACELEGEALEQWQAWWNEISGKGANDGKS
jgi:hypothetical protein